MPRPPKDEVAASTTITLRLTPDDRQRIDRQIEARAAELSERSMSALLRRLIRDGEEGVLLRLTPEDRAALDRLVADRAAELAKLGVYEAQVTPSSVVVGLIRDAARSKGLLASGEPQASAGPAAPRGAAPPDVASVRAALVAALEGGASQAEIGRKAGISPAQIFRFKKEGTGIGAENLGKLAKALGMTSHR